jgi:type III secretion system YscD/HrpQ family protein
MAAEFIAEDGVLKGLILVLEEGEEWTIGRDPDQSQIVLEDPKVSRLHARIEKTADGYSIDNLSDSNPVLVGGKPVLGPTLLHEDDLVTIGGTIFHFYAEGAPSDFGYVDETLGGEESFTQGEEEPLEHFEEEFYKEETPAFEKRNPEEELLGETLFEEPTFPEMHVDLTQTTRFILKVIAGPNSGAEFALDTDRSYLIGTDATTCDIIFNDLSVSREHARLTIDKESNVSIEDLNSRNGVLVDRERIVQTHSLAANSVVTLGTSSFMLIDREAPSETIAAPIIEAPAEEARAEAAPEEAPSPPQPIPVPRPPRRPFPAGALVLSLIICGLAVLLGIGMVSLLQTRETEIAPQKDRLAEIQNVMKQFPAVRFTYNPTNQKLFLMGHVRTSVEHNELSYQLKGLGFLMGIEDNVVNDEAIWQEMNLLLAKVPEFKGISMHSPEAGVFVVNGYLKTEKQAADLTDYLNINFNYLDRLQNRVVVEDSVQDEVANRLVQQGFTAVNPNFINGELILKGYISSTENFAFERLIEDMKKIPGVRSVLNLVATITPEKGVVDINKKNQQQGNILRYHVTGFSRHGDANVAVVINGRILTRGDCLDGYRITSIQPSTVFLEKDGLKYKIEYNKCKSFGAEE